MPRATLIWAMVAFCAACSLLGGGNPEQAPRPAPPAPRARRPAESGGAVERRRVRDAVVRVAVAYGATRGRLAGSGAWRLYDQDGFGVPVVRAEAGQAWGIERRAGRLRAIRADGVPTQRFEGTLVARPLEPSGTLSWDGRRYRGELAFVPAAGGGITVVNRLPIESYLRGVVPRELGEVPREALAAAQAQAVAARSYAYVRAGVLPDRPYDVEASVAHQVYGGADAERPLSDEAVASTAGLVLMYGGRVVDAPYHSTCGGSTAEPQEVWRADPEPYLRAVSDRIPGTDRFYCEGGSRFAWTRTFTGPQLDALLARYLGAYATGVPAGGPGRAFSVAVSGRTPSGRAAGVVVRTDRGAYALRGNDVRYVFRAPNGEILNSTYFSVDEAVVGRDGHLAQLTLRGNGYGHGVGMCQWGAIGRARAGHDFRTILRTYYPGATVGTID